ncbi:MAG: hypothetical protein KH295_02035 [Clostridiaceae bacterium]|nr:hypothetical protein [Clostridiaceae bacterium]
MHQRSEHPVSFYFQEAYHLSQELEKLPADAKRRSQVADETLSAAEIAVLAARRVFGSMLERPKQGGKAQRLTLRSNGITGTVTVSKQGWTVIRLDTLLQNARHRTTGYIENSILDLLKQWRGRGGVLPWYKHCFVAIVEHSDLRDSHTFDVDNKEWKSVTNALKGLLFVDDDQLTVSLILDTVPDGKGYTEIVVLPHRDAGRYLSERMLGG